MAGIAPELSRLLPREDILKGETTRLIEAAPEELQRLAERFDLIALESLSASVSIRMRGRKPLVRLEGRLEAEVVQACVVTLAPVRSRLEESFSRLYSLEALPETDGREVLVAAEGEEEPEVIDPEGLDLGEVVAEELGLALAPYPRAEGAELPVEYQGLEDEAADNPFAALEKWKGKI